MTTANARLQHGTSCGTHTPAETSELPDGPVLVVGGGNSGLQIVQELATIRRVDVSMAAKPAMLSLRLGMSPSRVSHQNGSRPS